MWTHQLADLFWFKAFKALRCFKEEITVGRFDEILSKQKDFSKNKHVFSYQELGKSYPPFVLLFAVQGHADAPWA